MMGDDWEQRNYPQRICRMICRSYCGGVLRLRRHGLEQHAWAAAILSGLALLSGCGGSTNSPGGGGNPPPSATATIRNQVTGTFKLAMSTSFQPAEWDYTLFQSFPSLTTTLGNLQPQHVRLQGQSQGIPQVASGSSSTAGDFAILDAITQPVLGVGDHSPEFQIAKAPPFLYQDNDNGNSFLDPTFQDGQFAAYAQNLVQYYNKGGFTANGTLYVSPAYPTDTITWWGIYNEPNINNNMNSDPAEYVAMYN